MKPLISSGTPPSGSVARQLSTLIGAETTYVRDVLSAIGAPVEASEFSTALAKYPDLEEDPPFLQVRHLIADTLLRLAPDGYSIRYRSRGTVTRSPDEMVREMVEFSSHKLALIGAIGSGRTL